MNDYDVFSHFYDAAVGERNTVVDLLRGFIEASPPNGNNLLELACGTGGILRHFAGEWNLNGLDASKGMLAVAREELPNAKFYRRDIRDFHIHQQFDVILCVYDSINHLLTFDDWQKVFRNVHNHLAPGGMFIFDVNTPVKLHEIVSYPPEIHKLGENYMLLKVRSEGKEIFNWNLRFFIHSTGNHYRLKIENIRETAFPSNTIINALHAMFTSVKTVDAERKRPSKNSERLYFICRK